MALNEESKLYNAIERLGKKIDVVGSKVTNMEATFNSYRKVLDEHDTIIHGRPGNGNNPGLQSRVLVGEIINKEAAKERRENTRWFRRRLTAVISALLVSVGLTGWNSWDKAVSPPPEIERRAAGGEINQNEKGE